MVSVLCVLRSAVSPHPSRLHLCGEITGVPVPLPEAATCNPGILGMISENSRNPQIIPGNSPGISCNNPGRFPEFPEVFREVPGIFPEILCNDPRKMPGNSRIPGIPGNSPGRFPESPELPRISRNSPEFPEMIPGTAPGTFREFPGIP